MLEVTDILWERNKASTMQIVTKHRVVTTVSVHMVVHFRTLPSFHTLRIKSK